MFIYFNVQLKTEQMYITHLHYNIWIGTNVYLFFFFFEEILIFLKLFTET